MISADGRANWTINASTDVNFFSWNSTAEPVHGEINCHDLYDCRRTWNHYRVNPADENLSFSLVFYCIFLYVHIYILARTRRTRVRGCAREPNLYSYRDARNIYTHAGRQCKHSFIFDTRWFIVCAINRSSITRRYFASGGSAQSRAADSTLHNRQQNPESRLNWIPFYVEKSDALPNKNFV